MADKRRTEDKDCGSRPVILQHAQTAANGPYCPYRGKARMWLDDAGLSIRPSFSTRQYPWDYWPGYRRLGMLVASGFYALACLAGVALSVPHAAAIAFAGAAIIVGLAFAALLRDMTKTVRVLYGKVLWFSVYALDDVRLLSIEYARKAGRGGLVMKYADEGEEVYQTLARLLPGKDATVRGGVSFPVT